MSQQKSSMIFGENITRLYIYKYPSIA